jgi:protein deglycase
MNNKVLVTIADGTEELEAITIIDTLRRANADVTVAAVGQLQIETAHGVKITADKMIDDCTQETYDLIVLPGGMPGAENLRDSEELVSLLKRQDQEGRYYAAICASPAIVLHSHGLLTNRSATCYPSFADQLDIKDRIDSKVVIDGNCITSQGPGTALKFALTLVELLFDSSKAKSIASDMLTEY